MGPHSIDNNGEVIRVVNKSKYSKTTCTELVTETVDSVLLTSFADEEEEEGGKVLMGAIKSKLPKH